MGCASGLVGEPSFAGSIPFIGDTLCRRLLVVKLLWRGGEMGRPAREPIWLQGGETVIKSIWDATRAPPPEGGTPYLRRRWLAVSSGDQVYRLVSRPFKPLGSAGF